MAGVRNQGRPRTKDRQFNRAKLLEKIRLAMSSPPRIELQRCDIAEVAGVTPALINYYFPDKWQMLEMAARPIIEKYVSEVTALLEADDSNEHKLRKLLRIYLVFNEENGNLFDYYVEAMGRQNDADGIQMLWSAHARISSYFRDAMSCGALRSVGPELVNALLWGICKHVANHSRDRVESLFPVNANPDARTYRANFIYDLLLDGLRP